LKAKKEKRSLKLMVDLAMRQVMNGGKDVYPSLLTKRPQPSEDFNFREKKIKYRSMSTEQGGSRNPYSKYTAAHYNYPVPTRAGYPPQPDEQYAAYPSHPDERYVAYPKHHCNDSSTYSHYYPSRNEHSDGDGATTEPNVYGHHSEQFRQNLNRAVSSRYQGK
jgi:hypothetical protein